MRPELTWAIYFGLLLWISHMFAVSCRRAKVPLSMGAIGAFALGTLFYVGARGMGFLP